MPYPILIGRRTRVTRDFKVTMLPYIYIVDQKGKIKEANIFLQEEDIRKVIDGLLEKTK